MKILSLFDGMSVAQQALKEAGIPVEVYYASEIDEYAIAVTQSNHPNTIQLESVTGIEWGGEVIDLLIGGSPCQDLSIAKKGREGLSGSRSGLFYEYVRILNEVKPKYFILENVASMPKEAKETITAELFGIEPIMINASLVSAQNRKRLFWVGKLRPNGRYSQVDIEQPEDRGILLKDILESDVDEKYFVNVSEKYKNKGLCEADQKSKAMTATMWKGYGNDGVTTVRVGSLNSGGQGDRIYSQDGKPVSLSANGGGRGAKTRLYCISSTQKHATITTEKSSPMVSAMGMGGGHVPMIASDDTQIRKLTPTECLRLQSMPDDYFDKALYKGKAISNTQRYKMCGNAFNKEVIVHILKHLN
jgi:DNA (cytosine-5)-methyltransferase 3A